MEVCSGNEGNYCVCEWWLGRVVCASFHIFFLAYACAFIYFQNMNEASSLLSATCNTFITTLEECVKIANAKFKPEMFQLPHPDPLVSPVSPSPVQMV